MKESQLLFAQIDHVSGEITGFAIGKLMELGAHNVQLIPTITKKNRPGNIIIVDTDVEHEGEIAVFLARELKISGYHKINTTHVFQKVSFLKKNLAVRVNGREKSFPLEIKVIGDLSDPLSMDIEHDFLVHVQEILNANLNYSISLSELRTIIEARLKEPGDEIAIDM